MDMGETISKEEIDVMIEKADLNGDGKICICDFLNSHFFAVSTKSRLMFLTC